jgi:hypothetical protein
MHTLKVVLGGLALLALCLVVGLRLRGRAAGRASGAGDPGDVVTLLQRSVSPSGVRHALLIQRNSRVAMNDLGCPRSA